ncbi:hypothetical protein BSQ33_05750 [Vibrio gazogenes]|uniref:Uncharacterized protein n=1 Tax=Vibrio gazogenes TaxID=687 RepID=A0A1Z2SDN7_VIBGA|nr:hypothetical protein BSQ33_05750 [Vibrio gazogenes]
MPNTRIIFRKNSISTSKLTPCYLAFTGQTNFVQRFIHKTLYKAFPFGLKFRTIFDCAGKYRIYSD